MQYRTAECVTPGHPDKMCDQISDAILDECLKHDPRARVAVETVGGHGEMFITGEVTIGGGSSKLTGESIKDIVKRIAGDSIARSQIRINVATQSPEIAGGVDTGGAGDQGIMVGYACNDNAAMIPQETFLARELAQLLYEQYPYDGKTQVTLDDMTRITAVVASFQNVEKEVLERVVRQWLNTHPSTKDVQIHANPAGDWSVGGFDADAGLTGRKLMVDNYGPRIPVGGGAFSGKDATKVDRSGAYIARKTAVSLLKDHSQAREVYVYLAYAIGFPYPVQATAIVHARNGSVYAQKEQQLDPKAFTPEKIIEKLKLREPKFEETARWGHFGRGFEWD